MLSATSCHCSRYHGDEDLILLQGYLKLCHSAICSLENENIPTPVLTCKPDTLLLSYRWFHPTFFFPINLPCWFNPPCLKSASSIHPRASWAVSTQRRYQSTLRCGDKVPVFVNVGFCVFSHLIRGLCLILAVIYFTHSLFHKLKISCTANFCTSKISCPLSALLSTLLQIVWVYSLPIWYLLLSSEWKEWIRWKSRRKLIRGQGVFKP